MNCYSSVVTLKSFGAKGDGLTDDIISITKATQILKDGDTLIFDANKNYLVGGKIVISVSCTILGNYATITPTDSFMRAGGIFLSVGKGLSNTAVSGLTAVKGANTITLPSTIKNVKPGDLIQFLSPDLLYSFRADLASFNYSKGQYAIVKNVAGDNITISTPFFDSFNVNTVAVFKNCDSTRIYNLTFNLSKQPDTKNPFIALAIRGTNSTVEKCSFKGNEYAFCAIQVDGENSTIKYCTIKDFFNVQGYSGGRLGYGINAACNNITIAKNTISNCKHGFTTAARKFVVSNIKVLQNTFTEDTLKPIFKFGSVNAQTDYAGTIDIHAGVSDVVLISENIIHAQGRAFFVRNGKAFILSNEIYQHGNPVGLIGVEERPVETLLIQKNNLNLSDSGSYLIGKYLSLADDALYMKNTIIRQNTCSNGWLFYNSSCKFDIDGLLIEKNIMKNSKVIYLLKSDSSVIFNNIETQTNTIN
ncbi:MAG: hypothetical protein ABIQ31_27225 [Ferruginibacter sp.]